LHELHHKIDFVKEQSFKSALSCNDVGEVLEKLKVKVCVPYIVYRLGMEIKNEMERKGKERKRREKK
jgi:hypothetical protein